MRGPQPRILFIFESSSSGELILYKTLPVNIRGSSCQQSYCYRKDGVDKININALLLSPWETLIIVILTPRRNNCNSGAFRRRHEACHTIHFIACQSSYGTSFGSKLNWASYRKNNNNFFHALVGFLLLCCRKSETESLNNLSQT